MRTTQYYWQDDTQRVMVIEIVALGTWADFMGVYQEIVEQIQRVAHPVVVILNSNTIPVPKEGNALSYLQRIARLLPPHVVTVIPVVSKMRNFERSLANIVSKVLGRQQLQLVESLETAVALAQQTLAKAA
jgi:Cdc6-like AAA superfamily ATPase